MSLELGGKGANIVFADAPADAVAKGIARCFDNTGQSCNAPTRMLVERSCYDAAVEEARAAAKGTAVGPAQEDGRHIGPLVSRMQFDKVQDLIAHGIDQDGALRIADDTDYGLTNHVQTSDGEKANRVARQLRSGMVDMNGQARPAGAPFGGYKRSGDGCEGGEWGLEEYLEFKAVGGWAPDAA